MYFATLFVDCLCHVCFRIYSQLNRKAVEKPAKVGCFKLLIFNEREFKILDVHL